MAKVDLIHIDKEYPGGAVAVRDLSLSITDGEFVVLVGPSGCGKTTTLRIVAGLESVTRGEVRIGDRPVTDLAPRDRNVAMVFQNYALYPHMTVCENMAFALRQRRMPRDEIERRVAATARSLGIHDLLERRPAALSGGQRQRVALGRAMVRDPQVFLFDEPLSNLDAQLRVQMRVELAQLHRRLGATMLYVTHDQVEAMTLADRVAVMSEGRLRQYGTPLEVYDRPADLFVAGFIGHPPMNTIRGRLASRDGALWFESDGVGWPLPESKAVRWVEAAGREVVWGIRPEHLRLVDAESGTLRGEVLAVETLGSESLLHVACSGHRLIARLQERPTRTAAAGLEPEWSRQHFFDAVTGRRLP